MARLQMETTMAVLGDGRRYAAKVYPGDSSGLRSTVLVNCR